MDLTALGDLIVGFINSDLGGYIVWGLAFSGLLAQLAAMTPWGFDDKAAGFVNRVFTALAGNWGNARSQPRQ